MTYPVNDIQADPNHSGKIPENRSFLSRIVTWVLTQTLGLAVFVGLPAIVTAIAPVSWVKLERRDGHVSAVAQTCLLFVVPYKTVTVDSVTGFSTHSIEGKVHRERRPGRDRRVKSEDEGFLVILGGDTPAEVAVSPVSLDAAIKHAEGFLNDSESKELSLFLVANWKFSVIVGGLISLLTLLYVIGIATGLYLMIFNAVKWAWRGPDYDDPFKDNTSKAS